MPRGQRDNGRFVYAEVEGPLHTKCWILDRFHDRYGSDMLVDGVRKKPHVHFYEKHKGRVPDALELDHLCRVTACVNPDHLEPVTHAENMRRGKVAKLKVEQVLQIRAELGIWRWSSGTGRPIRRFKAMYNGNCDAEKLERHLGA